MIPRSLLQQLGLLLGDAPRAVRPLDMSNWSTSSRFDANGQHLVVKWQNQGITVPPGWPSIIGAEAYGLRLLADTRTVRIPTVIAQQEQQEACPAFIVMEWIETSPHVDTRAAGRRLGEQLAALHRSGADQFGLDQHTWCGATPQPNNRTRSWIEFYGQQRLDFQMRLAAQNGRMPSTRRRRCEQLIDRLEQWIDDQAVQPSLIHGDLWEGNWLVDAAGTPVLIDPAVYFADREAELAMCHLFDGFPPDFFHAYDDAWPPLPGRDDRIPLYQLYHLLNHLNLFGERYGAQIDRVLQRYVG